MNLLAIPLLLLASTADVDVSIQLKDGSEVQGAIKTSSVKLTTGFGSAVVRFEHVAEIRFGEPDIVVTTDDVELRGKLKLTRLKVETNSGPKQLKRSQLAALVTLKEGIPRGSASFTGRWMSSFGPMELKQSGLTVQGKYGFDGEFSIKGKVKGNKLAFEYDEPRSSGTGTFELWESGDVFMGKFLATGSDNQRTWGAYRRLHKPAPATRGKTSQGQSKSGLNYHLRVPKSYDAKQSYPAIAFFHGSNMTSLSYVETIAARWPKLAKRYIIVGFDGEKISPNARPKQRAFNFSYVEFGGPEVGPKWAHRQSPALVAEALRELKSALPIEHWIVGGHSQGGFLTYAVALFYPDLVAGAFPMSCNLLVQCEPSSFTDEAIRRAQREIAFAPIHGENDTVVAFSGGEYCYRALQCGGFPAARFFTDPNAAHMFARLPVEQAIEWIETIRSEDAATVLAYGEASLAKQRYRDAAAALVRARDLQKRSARADALAKALDKAAAPRAQKLAKAIRAARNSAWVDDFWDFREEFAFAPAAAPVMRQYANLRAKHAKPAQELFFRARRERDDAARNRIYREILEKHYASDLYMLVKGWVK